MGFSATRAYVGPGDGCGWGSEEGGGKGREGTREGDRARIECGELLSVYFTRRGTHRVGGGDDVVADISTLDG